MIGTTKAVAALTAAALACVAARAQSPSILSAPNGGRGAPVYTHSPIPPVTITGQSQTMEPSLNAFRYEGDAMLRAGEELTITADRIAASLNLRRIDAEGRVAISELDTFIAASDIHYNGVDNSSSFRDVTYRKYPYTIKAESGVGAPGRLDLTNAQITTAPPGQPQILHVAARRLTIDNQHHRVIGHGVAFYLGGTRLLTIPSVNYAMPSAANKQQAARRNENVGYNSYDGLFVSAGNVFVVGNRPLSLSGTLSSMGKNSAVASTSFGLKSIPIHRMDLSAPPDADGGPAASAMAMIRDMSRAGEVPVPPKDPLRFHDFTAPLPMGYLFSGPQLSVDSVVTVQTAYKQRVYGTPVNYLYVSKWPEITLTSSAPIGAIRPEFPLGVDAQGTRRILRRPEFGTSISDTFGYYEEMPTRIDGTRNQMLATFGTRAFLVAPNLLCTSSVSYVYNQYGRDRLWESYPQATLAFERVFTDMTGIGTQLTYASITGHTPFTFDTLGAAHELDVRGQYGNGLLVFGALLQYDLQRRRPYDTRFSIGPNLHGIIPRVTYEDLTKTTGFALDIIGMTY